MNFFVDTGVIIGYSDIKDDLFYQQCSTFIKNYPFKSNSYHSNRNIVKTEIKNIQKRRKEHRTNKVFRLFIQRAKIFCEHISDSSYDEHQSYSTLYYQIHQTLKNYGKKGHQMDHDAKLLTSSYIWAVVNSDLKDPQFITTDFHDIYKNRELIEKEANLCLSCKSKLMIKFIADMV